MKHHHPTSAIAQLRTPHSALRTCSALLAICFISVNPPDASGAGEDPYRLLVCLHFPDDPLFTPPYTKSIQRQVQDQLANYFGALAKVEVVAAHPLIERLGSADVRAFQPAATEFTSLAVPDKAFVFSLENAEGMYRLHWRQFDGLAQQVSGVQSVSTPDRQWVTKAVCMAVIEDFAPVVIVEPNDIVKDIGQVRLEFPSPAHKALVSRWLTLDTILQPFYVLKQKDGSLLRSPIPYTVLRIGKNDVDQGTATFHSNQSNPWKPTPRLVRYEALKLSVRKGHLRLKLVNAVDGSPMTQCTARANTTGFASLTDSHQFTLPDRRGTVVSLLPIENLAFVEIIQGGRPWLKLPVPITAPVCEVTLKVSLDETAKEKSDWDRRLRYLVQDVSVLQTSINNQVRETNQMHTEKKYEEELRLIKSVLADVTVGRESAGETQDALDKEARDLKLPPNTLLTWVDAQIKEIADAESALTKKADALDQMIKKMDAQARADVLKLAAEAAAEAGDYTEAFDKYDLALSEQPDQPKLAERVRMLKEVWEIKSPEHERARKFIFERWAKAEVTELASLFAEAEQALAALQTVGDYLTAQRLLKVNNEHVGAVSGVTDLLIASGTEQDLADAEKYTKLSDRFLEFQDRIVAFITEAETGVTSEPAAPPTAAPAAAAAPAKTAPSKSPPVEEEEVPPGKR
jgi:hypothetical protein